MKLQMKRWLQTIAAGVLLLVGGAAHAVTPPGTIINNVARVTYTMPSLASTFTVNSTIATFQAVKHHCANMLVAAESSVAAVWDAARAAGDMGDDQAPLVEIAPGHRAAIGGRDAQAA